MPKTYSINYNLSNPGQDYKKVTDAIRSLPGSWAHPGGSHWFVSTSLGGADIRSRIWAKMDPNDQLYIHTVGDDWWSQNGNADVVNWLKTNWHSSCKV